MVTLFSKGLLLGNNAVIRRRNEYKFVTIFAGIFAMILIKNPDYFVTQIFVQIYKELVVSDAKQQDALIHKYEITILMLSSR